MNWKRISETFGNAVLVVLLGIAGIVMSVINAFRWKR